MGRENCVVFDAIYGTVPLPRKIRADEEPVLVVVDISQCLDGTIPVELIIPDLNSEEKANTPFRETRDPSTAKKVVLRFTNETGSSYMPPVHTLPYPVFRVEFDEATCSCITAFASNPETGFLSHSQGVVEVDLSGLPRLVQLGANFLASCSNVKSVTFPKVKHRVAVGDKFMGYCTFLDSIDLSFLSTIPEIPDDFLMGSGVGQVDLRDFTDLCSIGENFLHLCHELNTVHFPQGSSFTVGTRFMADCGNLLDIDVSFFRDNNQEEMPFGFLYNCASLKAIDVEPMSHVRKISRDALCGTKSLKVLDFSTFIHLEEIEAEFLTECISLEAVHFPTKMKSSNPVLVGKCFLEGCRNLRTVNLAFLAGTRTIPERFLMGCASLEHLDLAPLADVDSVGDWFLAGATSLTEVHLPFLHIQDIGNDFFSNSTALHTVTIRDGLNTVRRLGNNFFSGCHKLENINVGFLAQLTRVEYNFLSDCGALKHIDLTPLANVTSIAEYFLYYCHGLLGVDLSMFTNVTSIGNNFISGCSELHEVRNMDALCNIETVGGRFMSGCKSLTSADTSTWTNLKEIESVGFFENCTSLRSIALPPPPAEQVTNLRVHTNFLAGCTALEYVDLRFLANLQPEDDHNDRYGDHLVSCGDILKGCSPEVLKAIIIIDSPSRRPSRTVNIYNSIEESLRANIIKLKPGDSLPQLQWSWKEHGRHPRNVQLAVLWIFSRLRYRATAESENQRNVPGEVAYEICRFIGTPFNELLPGPRFSKQTTMLVEEGLNSNVGNDTFVASSKRQKRGFLSSTSNVGGFQSNQRNAFTSNQSTGSGSSPFTSNQRNAFTSNQSTGSGSNPFTSNQRNAFTSNQSTGSGSNPFTSNQSTGSGSNAFTSNQSTGNPFSSHRSAGGSFGQKRNRDRNTQRSRKK